MTFGKRPSQSYGQMPDLVSAHSTHSFIYKLVNDAWADDAIAGGKVAPEGKANDRQL